MKRIMLIGNTGCGKTTLCQRLHQKNPEYKKTQMIEHYASAIDTPGEYIENPSLRRAFTVTAPECSVVGFVQSATDENSPFPPGFASLFSPQKKVVGIVTKAECSKNIDKAKEILSLAGAEKIFTLSALTGEGMDALEKFLTQEDI